MPRSESYLEISGGPNPNDLMVWPDPADPEEHEWHIRHTKTGNPLVAASYMQAYRALIAMPQKLRNKRIEQIKHASEQAAERRAEEPRDDHR